MSTHRAKTRRRTMLWQAASIALFVGAGALLVVPLPSASGSEPDPTQPGDGRPVDVDNGSETTGITNLNRLAEILGGVNPATEETPPKPLGDDVVYEPPEERPEVVESRDPPPVRSGWVFLGSAVTPKARRALVRIEQDQKFLREGVEVGGIRLVEVHDDHIMIDEQGVRRRVDKAPMVADAGLAAPRAPAPAIARAGAPGATQPDPRTGMPVPLPRAMDGKPAIIANANKERLVARLHSLPPERLLNMSRVVSDASLPWEQRVLAISELGFDAAMSLDERREVAQAIGLDAANPEVIRLLEHDMNGQQREQR